MHCECKKSVRAAGGTGYIYTNNDLFVLHARITCKQEVLIGTPPGGANKHFLTFIVPYYVYSSHVIVKFKCLKSANDSDMIYICIL